VIEQIVADQITEHLDHMNLMPAVLHFRLLTADTHSTESALVKVLSDILDAADSSGDTSGSP